MAPIATWHSGASRRQDAAQLYGHCAWACADSFGSLDEDDNQSSSWRELPKRRWGLASNPSEKCRDRADPDVDTDLIRTLHCALVDAVTGHKDFDLKQLSNLVWLQGDHDSCHVRACQGSVLNSLLNSVPSVFGERVPSPSFEDDVSTIVQDTSRLDNATLQHAMQVIWQRLRSQCFDAHALASVVLTFAVLRVREGYFLSALCADASRLLHEVDVDDLAVFSWALGALGFRNVAFMEALARQIITRPWEFSSFSLAKVVFGFAALGLRHTPLLESVAHEILWKVRD